MSLGGKTGIRYWNIEILKGPGTQNHIQTKKTNYFLKSTLH